MHLEPYLSALAYHFGEAAHNGETGKAILYAWQVADRNGVLTKPSNLPYRWRRWHSASRKIAASLAF